MRAPGLIILLLMLATPAAALPDPGILPGSPLYVFDRLYGFAEAPIIVSNERAAEIIELAFHEEHENLLIARRAHASALNRTQTMPDSDYAVAVLTQQILELQESRARLFAPSRSDIRMALEQTALTREHHLSKLTGYPEIRDRYNYDLIANTETSSKPFMEDLMVYAFYNGTPPKDYVPPELVPLQKPLLPTPSLESIESLNTTNSTQ